MEMPALGFRRVFWNSNDGVQAFNGHPWREGWNKAECLLQPNLSLHPCPSIGCSCGYYAYWDIADAWWYQIQHSRAVLIATLADGKIITYPQGFRAENIMPLAVLLEKGIDRPSAMVAQTLKIPLLSQYQFEGLAAENGERKRKGPKTKYDPENPPAISLFHRWMGTRMQYALDRCVHAKMNLVRAEGTTELNFWRREVEALNSSYLDLISQAEETTGINSLTQPSLPWRSLRGPLSPTIKG